MEENKDIKRFDSRYRYLIITSIVVFGVEIALSILFATFYLFDIFGLKTAMLANFAIFLTIILSVVVFNIIYMAIVLAIVVKGRGKNDLSSAELLGSGVDEAYNSGKVGLIVVDKTSKDEYIIIWANSFILNRHGQGKDVVINSDIRKIFPGIKVDTNEDSILKKDSYTYKVKYLTESGLFIFSDVTDYSDLYDRYENESTVVGLVRIDNYSSESRLRGNISLMSDIKHMIAAYFEEYEVFLDQTSEDAFTLFCDKEALNVLIKDQFSILDKVKGINTDSSYQVTISIGIGAGIPNVIKLKEMASSALKEALTRGGDQAVISQLGKNTMFIGGKTLSKSTQNNADTRDNANKILKFIDDSDEIIIMGHTATDLDAFGSALGLFAMSQYKKKPAHIVFDKNLAGNDVRTLVINDFGLTNPILISPKDAVKLAKSKSNCLIIICDVSSREMVLCEELLDVYQIKILVIDHHQPGANTKRIDNPIGVFINPSASSCSEMVTNYIHYATANPKIELSEHIATIMLSGILLDTDSYRRDTTSPATYEASMFLKEYGADNQLAAKIVMGSKEEFLMLNKYMGSMETIAPGVAYVVVDEGDDAAISDTLLSKIADNFIRIRDIKASFVLGKITSSNKSFIKCSARSDGSINVGKLMMMIGGGGRFNAAAGTWRDKTLSECEKNLISTVRDHIDECRYIARSGD